MPFHTLSDLKALVPTLPEQQTLYAVNALSTLLRGCLFPDKYEADGAWQNIVRLTEEGTWAMKQIEVRVPYTQADLMLAMLRVCHHQELLVDWTHIDIEAAQRLVSREAAAGRIKWPQRFGRLLYDKFRGWAKGKKYDHLTPAEGESLLEGTPQGVYQADRLIVGPLGLLTGETPRFMAPTHEVPLWHCPDPGCQYLHTVEFLERRVAVVELTDALDELLEHRQGPTSPWLTALVRYRQSGTWTAERAFTDICLLVANAVVESERTSLTAAAIQAHAGSLRKILTHTKGERSAQGDAQAVAEGLSTEEQLQLLLVLSDIELVHLLDECVFSGKLGVPASEVRRAREVLSEHESDPRSELSTLGVRAHWRDPIIALSSFIRQAYESRNVLPELAWRVRKPEYADAMDAVAQFIREHGPAKAISDLVLSSKPVTEAVMEQLGVRFGAGADGTSIDRIAWKAGFEQPRYEESYRLLGDRIARFTEIVLAAPEPFTERTREDIRSVGVNLFVSVEEFIEQLVVYNVWLLSSDHFAKTNWTYRPGIAVRQVSAVLGNELKMGEDVAAWNVRGNTLSVLLRYAQACVEWVARNSTREPSDVERPAAELPFFSTDSFRQFPFRHTELWADTNRAAYEAYATGLKSIVSLLQQADPAGVRNGLDHMRGSGRFPVKQSMLACAAGIRGALDAADAGRYVPKTWWPHSAKTIINRGTELEYRDYAARPIRVYAPPIVWGLRETGAYGPIIIAPGMLLGRTNAQLIFAVEDESTWSKYWANYPRKDE